jgi:hypothetical protein
MARGSTQQRGILGRGPLSTEALKVIVLLLAEAPEPVDSTSRRCRLCGYHQDDVVVGPHGVGCPWKLANNARVEGRL